MFYILVTSLCLAAFFFVMFYGLGYRVNRSASLPFLIYKTTHINPETDIRCGDCVLVDLSKISNAVIDQGIERGYVNLREPMLKRIGAIPGDTVVLTENLLSVNDEVIEMKIAPHDSNGKELSAWPTPITLQLGEYWLVSDPERGFDSRYFGPVNAIAFTHKAKPIF